MKIALPRIIAMMIYGLFIVFGFANHVALALDDHESTNPFSRAADNVPAMISVDPNCLRSIKGKLELERDRWFVLSDPGTRFDQRVKDQEMYDRLIGELGIGFGRSLGPVDGIVRSGNSVKEDAERPGYADLGFLAKRLSPSKPSRQMLVSLGKLNIALHDRHNAYPDFMGKWTTPQAKGSHDHQLPQNIEAAAELAAAVIELGYYDFDRPRFFEPVNEPHWSFIDKQHVADWHLATRKAVQSRTPEVLVGGPCKSVAYLYRREYGTFKSLAKFIDNTNCELDFYSYHAYDYLKANEDGAVWGRITSGLPLAGVIDLLPNYSHNKYGREVALVFSEHGGYNSDGSLSDFGRKQFNYLDGFEKEMKVRELSDFVAMHSMISNFMEFVEHPHIVQKAVPFILLESFGWDPRYYAAMYAPGEFKDQSVWVPSKLVYFFQLFRGVQGNRVFVSNRDPDVQARAYRHGSTLYIALNNLSLRPEPVQLSLSDSAVSDLRIRRLTRQVDGTPAYSEHKASPKVLEETIRIQGQEAIVFEMKLANNQGASEHVDEVPFYGDKVVSHIEAGKSAELSVSLLDTDLNDIEYATMRVGFARVDASSSDLQVRINGHLLKVEQEHCGDRLWTKDDNLFATTKLISVDRNQLKAVNKVELSFPDGRDGYVGSVVIRAGILKKSEGATPNR